MPETPADPTGSYFHLFNEVGIIAQLSRALLEARLPDGLLITHFTVVNHLIRVQDGRTPLDLARAFRVPKTSMTHTLAGMAKRGLIDMRPNPEDARSKQVWLTDAGRAFRDRAIAEMGQNIGGMRDVLSPEELGQVIASLEKLRKRLDAMRD